MLHIILLLLKIIGILLLCIFGLILLILLVTLFVPIRYRVAIEHGEKLFYLKGRVNWLLHIIHLSITHIEGILHLQARLFGFVVYDNLKPRRPKKEKKPRVAKQKAVKQKATKNKVVKNKALMSSNGKSNAVTSNTVDSKTVDSNTVKYRETEALSPGSDSEIKASPIETKDSNNRQEDILKENQISKEDTSERIAVLVNKEPKEAPKEVLKEEPQAEPKEAPKSFLRRLMERFQGIKDKIVSTVLEWKAKMSRIFATVSSFRAKAELILNFIRDEMNKEGMHLTFSSLKRLIKHILPTKLKSKLIFGTGDPCSTGQALGAISILYSFYGDKLQITPDFEREILEGKHFARGRIRLVTILIIVVKLIFDKRFKQLKNNFIILKEAL